MALYNTPLPPRVAVLNKCNFQSDYIVGHSFRFVGALSMQKFGLHVSGGIFLVSVPIFLVKT